MTGIIYLVQPAELVGTDRYKFGCSKKKTLDRVRNGYKKGTRYLHIAECEEPHKTEGKIKEIFNQKFKLIAGNEYYEGDESIMKTEFINLIMKENKNLCKVNIEKENLYKEKNKIQTITHLTYMCHLCNKKFNKKCNLKKHLERKNPCVKPKETTNTTVNTTVNTQITTSEHEFRCKFCNLECSKKNIARHYRDGCYEIPTYIRQNYIDKYNARKKKCKAKEN